MIAKHAHARGNGPRAKRMTCCLAAAVLISTGIAPAAAQTFTTYATPTINPANQQPINLSAPTGITAGPDGNIWYTLPAAGDHAYIGKITTGGQITTYYLGFRENPQQITVGPDGALWYPEDGVNPVHKSIGRISTTGVNTRFQLASDDIRLSGITAGPDGNLWFTKHVVGADTIDAIGRMTPGGSVTEFPIPTHSADAKIILVGPDNALWFIESGKPPQAFQDPYKIGRITTSGTITEFPISFEGTTCQPAGFAKGSDGNLWFACGGLNRLGRMTTAGQVTVFPTVFSEKRAITRGADGALWYIGDGDRIGRMTTDGAETVYDLLPRPQGESGMAWHNLTLGPDNNIWLAGDGGTTTKGYIGKFVPPVIPASPTTIVSAILPTTRSVATKDSAPPKGLNVASAFNSTINTGTKPGIACGLSAGVSVPNATFGYQTTNPATNAVTGTPNTPADIPAGGTQTYVFSFTASAAFAPVDVPIIAKCNNSDAAPTVTGLTTFQVSAADNVADVIALAATVQNDGVVHLPGPSGVSVFAVATSNVGASSAITVSADTGATSLPVTITICQSNPQTGQCLAAPTPTVTLTMANGATPTFSAFVQATGTVPFDPAHNRIFMRFKDSGGTSRGATSVAATTQ